MLNSIGRHQIAHSRYAIQAADNDQGVARNLEVAAHTPAKIGSASSATLVRITFNPNRWTGWKRTRRPQVDFKKRNCDSFLFKAGHLIFRDW